MNTRILSILFVSFLLGACASAPGVSTNPALSGCPAQTIWWCRGNGAAPRVKIMTAGKLKVSPSCVDVAERSTLVFMILPPDFHAEGAVEIVPKEHTNLDHAWLSGTNSPNKNVILIDVPNTVSPREKYDYGVIIGSNCIDPRVHIEN